MYESGAGQKEQDILEEDAIENIRTMHVTNNGLAAIISANRETIDRQRKSIQNIQREIKKISTDIENLDTKEKQQKEICEQNTKENQEKIT